MGADRAGQTDVPQTVGGGPAKGVQPGVHRVDDFLLVGELARDSRHALPPWLTCTNGRS
ncbi:hypothetical protein GCM10010102_15820 [Promicromonospora citrea]|uniref:Uncharacterized protein n=1 Tax=Promicromonospora citrea TaxID=43677 RepID=A0A8H9GG52_9MICO|nr:hypothetical protein GCM10010102_15820 [Promicromonospora citrea]